MGIEIKNVSKNFGETKALSEITLSLNEKKIYGLLGNNGAGKTTLLNIISNRIYPTSGSIIVDGELAFDNDRALNKLVMVSEKNFFPEGFRVEKALRCSAEFYPNFDYDYAIYLAKQFKLNLRTRMTKLSTGYGTIFRCILALAANTPYVLFDEPVLGLDAQHRDMLYKEIIALHSRNPRTIVISTHLISEVESLIEQTIIIDEGCILHNEPTEELLSRACTLTGPIQAVEDVLLNFKTLSKHTIGAIEIACVEIPRESQQDFAQKLPEIIEVCPMSLQDYFVATMNARHYSASSFENKEKRFSYE